MDFGCRNGDDFAAMAAEAAAGGALGCVVRSLTSVTGYQDTHGGKCNAAALRANVCQPRSALCGLRVCLVRICVVYRLAYAHLLAGRLYRRLVGRGVAL